MRRIELLVRIFVIVISVLHILRCFIPSMQEYNIAVGITELVALIASYDVMLKNHRYFCPYMRFLCILCMATVFYRSTPVGIKFTEIAGYLMIVNIVLASVHYLKAYGKSRSEGISIEYDRQVEGYCSQ